MKYFLYGLALLFIGLKLAGFINWSWWLVTLPLWFGIALLALVLLPCVFSKRYRDAAGRGIWR